MNTPRPTSDNYYHPNGQLRFCTPDSYKVSEASVAEFIEALLKQNWQQRDNNALLCRSLKLMPYHREQLQ